MKVIRDESAFGALATSALAIEWDIRRCNYKGCTCRTVAAIITGIDGVPAFGLCEKHYQEGNTPGGIHMQLDFTPLPEDVSEDSAADAMEVE